MPFKKFFLLFSYLILNTLYLILSPSPVFAQSPSSTTENQFLKVQNAADPGKTTLERWSEDSIISSLMSILRGLIGKVPTEFFEQLSKLTSTGQGEVPKLVVGGALDSGTQMIATLFTPPASGIQYIAQTWDNVLGKPAYAQGFGFKGLEFLLPLWKGFRNLVYVLSSIIFVVIGLMIILRVKISPQAVVTVQSAIPAVITTLILVTFSYAIAGLMIDLGNIILAVVMALIFNMQGVALDKNLLGGHLIGDASGFPIISDIMQIIQNIINTVAKPFQFTHLANPNINTLNGMAFMAAPHWWSLMLLGGLVGGVITGIFLGSIGNIVGGPVVIISSLTGKAVGGVAGGLIGMLIIPIILSIIVGIWLIKLFFGLIKVYVTIIFKIITGPLEIAIGAFPNAKIGFSSWFFEIFANIMVFPIVTIFFVILTIITDALFYAGPNAWAPGLINSTDTLYNEILSAAVGMAGLALISKLPDMIPQYIFMIKPNPWGQAIGDNMKTPAWIKQGGQMAIGTGATMAANKLTAPGIDAFGNPTAPALSGWQATAVNVGAGFLGGKPKGA